MDSIYIRAALIQPPRIAGVKVRPFSLWHALVFMCFNNAFVTGSPRLAGDVVEALLLLQDTREHHLRTYLRFTNNPLYRWFWKLRLSCVDFIQARDDLDAFIDAFTEAPECWQTPGALSSRSAILGPFKTFSVLLSYTGLSESRIWNMPYIYALCIRASIAEEHGVDVVDEADSRAADEAIKAFERGETTNGPSFVAAVLNSEPGKKPPPPKKRRKRKVPTHGRN